MQIAEIKPSRPDHPLSEILPAPVELDYRSLVWRRLKRDPTAMAGAGLVLLLVLVTLLAPLISPHDPDEQFRDGLTPLGQPIPSTLQHGSWKFPLGTDPNGRDLLTRLLYGARVSLLVGVLANTLAVTLGTLIGMPALAAACRDGTWP